jgi:DHA2 family methylenomycin A resistance protein-like MFS transporter
MAVLIAARVIQGTGAAMLVPSSLALLRAAYDVESERARAVGIWGGVAGIGAASGPILGGALATLISWRAIFVVNLPLGALGLAMAPGWLAPATSGRSSGFDPAGQTLGMLALGGLTFGLIEGGAAGWSSPRSWVPLGAALLAAGLMIAVERRTRDPMLPLGLFRRPTFSAATFVGLAINLGFYGQLFALSLYFQRLRGLSALEAGLALLPQGGFVVLASMLSGRLTGRLGPRVPMLGGLGCGAAGLAGLIVAGRTTPYVALVAPLVAAGFGMALTMPAATAAVIASAPGERAGIAAGVLNASRQAGGAVGVALLGTLIAGQAFVPGLRMAMAAAAGAFVLAASVASAFVDRAPGAPRGVRHHGR